METSLDSVERSFDALEHTVAKRRIALAAEPIREDFRTIPISEGFDWPEIMRTAYQNRGDEPGSPRYLVVFRSVRRPDASDSLIRYLDAAAHKEAADSQALDYYGASEIDEAGRALSWCLWTDQFSARAALNGPAHRNAVEHAEDLYESYDIELYNVTVSEDGHIILETLPHPRRGNDVVPETQTPVFLNAGQLALGSVVGS